MPESGGPVLTLVYKVQPEEPLWTSERIWSDRSGRHLGICCPASRGRVCVRHQSAGDPPGGSKRTGAAHRLVPFDWRDIPLPCARPRRARLAKHDELAMMVVQRGLRAAHAGDVFQERSVIDADGHDEVWTLAGTSCPVVRRKRDNETATRRLPGGPVSEDAALGGDRVSFSPTQAHDPGLDRSRCD